MPDYKLYTVGWICAIEAELVAALELLDDEETDPVDAPLNDNNTYTLGRIGKHNVVIAALPSGQYGTTSAANVARDMVRTFPNIRIGLMVGIGGGVPTKHDIRLGDVVVSSPHRRDGGVIQYDYGKAMQGQGLLIKGSLNQPPTSILTAMTKLRAMHTRKGHKLEQTIQAVLDKNKRLVNEYQRPSPEADELYRTEYIHASSEKSCAVACDKSNMVQRSARSLNEDNHKIHYGLIASGNQVMKDAVIRDWLSADEDVLCFEMEAAGLNNHFPCVVIRGICDYSDSHKNDAWQGYAAMMAAAYSKELLLHISPQRVEAEKKVEELLADVRKPILEMNTKVGALELKSRREEDLKILDWISKSDYTFQQSDFIQKRQPGTGKWFLECERFQTWQRRNPVLSRSSGEVGIAYVYCDYQKKKEQSTNILLASILRQLSEYISPLPAAVRSLYMERRHEKDDIVQALQSVANLCTRAFIIIDALDELEATESCLSAFISEVSDLRHHTSASIFITSRPSKTSESKLQPCMTQEIYAQDEDVRLYIDQRMKDMLILGDDNLDLSAEVKSSLKCAILERITQVVKGVFLLAPFYLQSLKDKTTTNQILTALKELRSGPEAYADAYEKTMVRIRSQGPGHRELAKRALTWLVFAKGRWSLTVFELRHALSVREKNLTLDEGDIQSTSMIIHACMGLVKVQEGSSYMSLLHYTTMEYFEANPGSLLFSDDSTLTGTNIYETSMKRVYAQMVATCDAYLTLAPFGCGDVGFMDYQKRLDLHPFYQHAAHYWGSYAFEAGPYCPALSFLRSQAYIAAWKQQAAFLGPGNGHLGKMTSRFGPPAGTGLHWAAYYGLNTEVDNFLEMGTNPDVLDEWERTPLMYAADQGHMTVMEQLLVLDEVDVNARDDIGLTALVYAAIGDHIAVVRRLLATGQVNPDSLSHGRTPLSYAAESGAARVVELLLQTEGVDPDSQECDPDGQNEDIPSFDKQFDVGRTPLSYAAERGFMTIVKMLLAKGVDLNSKNEDGFSPYYFARRRGQEAVVDLLLSIPELDTSVWRSGPR